MHWNQCGSQTQVFQGFQDSRIAQIGNYGALSGRDAAGGKDQWQRSLGGRGSTTTSQRKQQETESAYRTYILGYEGRELGWKLVEARVKKISNLYLFLFAILLKSSFSKLPPVPCCIRENFSLLTMTHRQFEMTSIQINGKFQLTFICTSLHLHIHL